MLVTTYSIFQSVTASNVSCHEVAWSQLRDKLLNPATVKPSKKQLPLIKMGAFGNQRTEKGSLRSDENLISVTGVEGDYDAGLMTMQEAAEKLQAAEIECVLYTTPSHTAESPRWRVIAPLTKPIAAAERATYVNLLDHILGGSSGAHILANESWTASQAFYVGKVEGAPYEAVHIQGYAIDLVDLFTDITPPGHGYHVDAHVTKVTGPTGDGAGELGRPFPDARIWTQGIIEGIDLHDNTLRLAGSLVAQGMPAKAALSQLQGLMEASLAKKDSRWQERYDDLPRLVGDAKAKFAPDPEAWGDLKLPDRHPRVPKLTAQMLPGVFRPWCVDIADRMQVPMAMVAAGALTMFSSVVGNRCAIYPNCQWEPNNPHLKETNFPHPFLTRSRRWKEMKSKK
jgi:hypothetical protein